MCTALDCTAMTGSARWHERIVGLAAGFDKDAQAMEPLVGLGLGFVEIGDAFELPLALSCRALTRQPPA
jgi:dihydroorotate dehydrogenase